MAVAFFGEDPPLSDDEFARLFMLSSLLNRNQMSRGERYEFSVFDEAAMEWSADRIIDSATKRKT